MNKFGNFITIIYAIIILDLEPTPEYEKLLSVAAGSGEKLGIGLNNG